MINIDGLVQEVELEIQASFDEHVVSDFPEMADWENRREFDAALNELTAILYNKLEGLLDSKLERALDDLHDVLGDSSEFFLQDFDGDNFFLQHKETGIDLRLEVEEAD